MINPVRPPVAEAAPGPPAPPDSLHVAIQRGRYRGPALTDEQMSAILAELRQGARFAVRTLAEGSFSFHLTATILDGWQTLVALRED